MMHKLMLSAHCQTHASQLLPAPRRAASRLRSHRVVLGLTLLFALLVPELLHRFDSVWERWFIDGSAPFGVLLIASTFALLAAHIALRQLGMLPLELGSMLGKIINHCYRTGDAQVLCQTEQGA
jgi:hypothetical protein